MTNETYLATTDQDRDAITALHWVCFDASEQAALQVALDDENCFTLLAGCDEDDQPYGFAATRIQDKVAYGLWSGIRPERRGKGRYRNLMLAALNESRVRGAEIYDLYIAEGSDSSDATLHLHKKLGFVLVDSNLDWTIRDGERHEFTNHLFRISLMTGK